MQFPYKKVPSSNNPQDPWIPLPLITIRLSHNGRLVQLDALIDSGATASLFHSVVADKLGVDLRSGLKHEFVGISGHSVEAYLHEVELQILGMPNSLKVAAAFTESPGVGALLGQADFFQHYQIKFERYKERMEINPAKGK